MFSEIVMNNQCPHVESTTTQKKKHEQSIFGCFKDT